MTGYRMPDWLDRSSRAVIAWAVYRPPGQERFSVFRREVLGVWLWCVRMLLKAGVWGRL